ncbi:sensor histidine kinase [Peribacillus sp. NPDC096540]|uniref:sensor histidine kinase n=1 Tax=Peribacillus sp. NPDC096540 TaxID=3390612 RepID=UPI003D0199E6
MGVWLINLRIVMFLMISFFYYWRIPDSDVFFKGFVIVAAVGFMLNHYLIFHNESFAYKLRIIYLDGLLSFGFGFLFPNSTLYLILVGVITVTLFIVVTESKKHRIYGLIFVLLWFMVMAATYLQTGKLDIIDNLMSISFVVFSAVVGDLIRKLIEASDVMSEQFLQLNMAHEELSLAHQQLQSYSHQVEEAAKIREGNRIARDIHDTVGHKMTALFVQMELANELLKYDLVKTKDTLNVCMDLAQGALEEVRFSVRALKEEEEAVFLPNVRRLLDGFYQSTGLQSTLELRGDPSNVPTALQLTIIRLIQEGLTNAKRHGDASISSIKLDCLPEKVMINIEDNGKGASMIIPGFGLKNMKDRIIEMGGELLYESVENEGFRIFVEFPLTEKKWVIGGTS